MAAIKSEKNNRERQTNWSLSEINLLTNLYEENMSVINDRHGTDVTNKKKNAVWEAISSKISALGVAVRTVENVKVKWWNLQKNAKKEFCLEKKSMCRTGGGHRAQSPSPMSRVINMLGDTASFSGVPGGIETFVLEDIDGTTCIHVSDLPTDEAETEKSATLPEQSAQHSTDLKVSAVSLTTKIAQANRKRKQKASLDDLQDAQCRWFKNDIEKQELEKEKLRLQIQLLKGAIDKQNSQTCEERLHSIMFK